MSVDGQVMDDAARLAVNDEHAALRRNDQRTVDELHSAGKGEIVQVRDAVIAAPLRCGQSPERLIRRIEELSAEGETTAPDIDEKRAETGA